MEFTARPVPCLRTDFARRSARHADSETVAAMRLLWERLKLIIEPSSATVLAAVPRYRERFAGRRIGSILSGGNVDLDSLPW